MVKPGYKQTEIGVIPKDWSVSDFGCKVKIYRGGSPRPIQDYLTQAEGGINWIKIGDVREGDKYITSTEEKIIPAGVSRSRSVHAGDFILSNSMSFGRPYILNIDGCIHDGWLTIQEYEKTFSKNFLYYLLSSDSVYQQYISMAAGSSVKNLNKEKISALVVAYPDLGEQEKIADALSSIDSLIATLEKQISKKKDIKQGAMQELMTGKRRLPGFNGAWREVRLEDICSKITDGSHESPPESDVGYYMPSVKDMTSTGFDYSECKKISYADFMKLERNGCRPDIGDVLIAKDGSILKYAFVQEQTETIVILSSIAIVKPLSNCVDSFFLAQYFRQQNFVEQVITNYKSGTGVPRIVLKGFKQIELFIPESVAEQATIAKILVDMDKEIAGLEKKLGKYRQVKQGMMQQLLTGKIRLKNDVVDSVHTEQKASAKKSPVRSAHNRQFDDAVSIAAIVDAFYSDKYPLGRVKVQKLLYLLHRHQAVSVSDFKKKAAGPYADTVRYRGGEPIAKKNKYIVSESGKQGTRYSKGENMAQALDYVERWGMQADLQWLKDNFLHTSRNDLELFSTVDMAMCDLDEVGISVSVESIKNLIASNKEWKAKLSKTYFSDWDIARAIKKCTELFN